MRTQLVKIHAVQFKDCVMGCLVIILENKKIFEFKKEGCRDGMKRKETR